MVSNNNLLANAQSILRQEADAILQLSESLNSGFSNAVQLLHNTTGQVIVTGVGKSAIIAQKIVATLNSTGTRAVYLHASDAIHGDIGIITGDDVLVCLSKSGNTPEIRALLAVPGMQKLKIIGITANTGSTLAQLSTVVLLLPSVPEACPLNLAPTTSTTAQLALGDALAVCLMQLKNFSRQDFARLHPGGSLGLSLISTARQFVKYPGAATVTGSATIPDIIQEITKNRLGAVVVTENTSITGIITDGDIRRMLQNHTTLHNLTAFEVMSAQPKTIDAESSAIDALEILTRFNISQLVVTTNGQYYGMLHLHDLLDAGLTLKNI